MFVEGTLSSWRTDGVVHGGSERADATVELRDATAVSEAGLSAVAAARVDASETDRLVAFASCHDL